MAQVNIIANTKTGKLEVKINGETIDNVSSVSLSPMPAYAKDEEDKVYVRVSTYKRDDDDGVSVMTDYCCSNEKLIAEVSRASQDIAKYFADKKNV